MAPFVLVADRLTVWSNLPRDGFSLYYQHGAGRRGDRLHAARPGDSAAAAAAAFQRRRRPRDADLHHLGHQPVPLRGVRLHVQPRLRVLPGLRLDVAGRAMVGAADAGLHARGWRCRRPQRARPPHQRDLRAAVAAVRRRALARPARASDRASRSVAPARDRVGRRRRVLAPQLALYRWVTGSWFVNAYVPHGMGFDFAAPHLADVLFSTQKGNGRRTSRRRAPRG